MKPFYIGLRFGIAFPIYVLVGIWQGLAWAWSEWKNDRLLTLLLYQERESLRKVSNITDQIDEIIK